MLRYPELLTQVTLQQLSMKPFLILCYIGCTLGKLKHDDSGSGKLYIIYSENCIYESSFIIEPKSKIPRKVWNFPKHTHCIYHFYILRPKNYFELFRCCTEWLSCMDNIFFYVPTRLHLEDYHWPEDISSAQ